MTDKRVERLLWGGLSAALALAGIVAMVSVQRYNANLEAVKQREAEKTKLIQDGKTARTETRAETVKAVVPWSKKGASRP